MYVCMHLCVYVCVYVCMYRNLGKERPWRNTLQVHQEVGWVLFQVFPNERVPMSCLKQLNAPEANNFTNNNVQRSCQKAVRRHSKL